MNSIRNYKLIPLPRQQININTHTHIPEIPILQIITYNRTTLFTIRSSSGSTLIYSDIYIYLLSSKNNSGSKKNIINHSVYLPCYKKINIQG